MKDLIIVSGTEFGLDVEKAKEIELGFYPSLQKMNDLKPLFDSVVSKEITPAVCAEAKAVRLQFVKCRTDTAKIHKAFKGFYLAGGRFVDAWKNKQTEVSEQIEAKLEEIEKHFEIIEQKKKEELRIKRTEILKSINYLAAGNDILDLEAEAFDNFCQGIIARAEMEKRIAEEKRIIEEKRLFEEKAERERIAAENKKLREEAEKAAAEKKVLMDEIDRKERERIAVERKARAAEETRKIEEEVQKMKAKKEEMERLRIEQEKLAEILRGSDKDKIKHYFSVLSNQLPEINDKLLKDQFNHVITHIRDLTIS